MAGNNWTERPTDLIAYRSTGAGSGMRSRIGIASHEKSPIQNLHGARFNLIIIWRFGPIEHSTAMVGLPNLDYANAFFTKLDKMRM